MIASIVRNSSEWELWKPKSKFLFFFYQIGFSPICAAFFWKLPRNCQKIYVCDHLPFKSLRIVVRAASAFFVRCCCCKCHQDFDKCFCYCGLFVEPTDGIGGPFIKKINVSLSRICPIVTRATTRFSPKIVKKQTYLLVFINKNSQITSIWSDFEYKPLILGHK